ncbi:MAG: hypothetical protein C5B50_06175 [Verrucomicrobia bacterium]|nr:MAG: hypothetical protein C5B50_06175 [Verrucomicrobiota bacterium]
MAPDAPKHFSEPGALPGSATAGGHAAVSIRDHELICRIGEGAYGEVWLARNIMGTLRAVKIVYRRRFDDERPYQREFSGIQKFEPISRSHEGFVDILQIGRNDAEGYFYYVMEVADDASRDGPSPQIEPGSEGRAPSGSAGGDLPTYIPRTLKLELSRRKRLPVQECIEIALSLCAALEVLHRSGLAHRDIKPANIIFINGKPKLADIGLVAGLNEARSFVGTEGFIPPEGPGTAQADIFSLGKVLYEMSSGKDRRLFPDPPTQLTEMPDATELLELDEVISKACHPDPRKRYSSAEAMRQELVLLTAGRSVRRVRLIEKRFARLKPLTYAAAGLALLASAAWVGSLRQARRAEHFANLESLQRQKAEREADRARVAEQEAKEKLRSSYFAQAQAQRWSGRVGRRFAALEALHKAAEIRPSLELRNEAIACLALMDLRTVRIWEAAPEGAVFGNFDSDYKRYARLQTNGVVSIRAVEDDRELAQFPGYVPVQVPYSSMVEFSPDGRFLAVAHGATTDRLDLWDLLRKERIIHVEGRVCRTLAFTPDSQALVVAFHGSGDPNRPVVMYDTASGQAKTTFEHHTLPYVLRPHPSKALLATSSHESTEVLLWNIRTGDVIRRLPHPGSVADMRWNPAGELLATTCGNNEIYLWDADTGVQQTVLRGHEGAPVRVDFSFDGEFLVSRGNEGMLRFWNMASGEQLFKYPVPGFSWGFSKNSYLLGYHPSEDKVGLLEFDPARECRLLRPGPVDGSGQSCCFGPNPHTLVAACENGVRMWNTTSRKTIGFLSGTSIRSAAIDIPRNRVLIASRAGITAHPLSSITTNAPGTGLRVSPLASEIQAGELLLSWDCSTLAFADSRAVHVLDLASGKPKALLPQKFSPVFAALDPEGTRVATWNNTAKSLSLWEVANSNLVREIPLNFGGSRAAFSPNGKWLALGDHLEYRILDLATGKPIARIPRGDTGYFGFMAFSPDGAVLGAALDRDNIALFEAATGAQLAVLEAPEPHEICDLCFNPHGSQLAVLYVNGQVQLWDLLLLHRQLAAIGLDWKSPLAQGP